MIPSAPPLYIDANVLGDLLKQFRSAIPDSSLSNAQKNLQIIEKIFSDGRQFF